MIHITRTYQTPSQSSAPTKIIIKVRNADSHERRQATAQDKKQVREALDSVFTSLFGVEA